MKEPRTGSTARPAAPPSFFLAHPPPQPTNATHTPVTSYAEQHAPPARVLLYLSLCG